MKHLIIFLSLFTFISCSWNCSESNSSKIGVKIYVDREYFVPYDKPLYYIPENDTILEKRYDVKVSVLNKSDKLVSFWLWSCSWEDNFQINNSYIFFNGHSCRSDGPRIVKINPGDSIVLKTTLLRAIGYDNRCENCIGSYDRGNVETTKISLLLVELKDCKKMNDFFNTMGDKSKWGKIIWSNPLYLNK